MSLYTRLLGLDEPKIPVHQFMAMLGEFERGKISGVQIASALGLSPAEETEALALAARVITPLESVSLGGLVALTNVGSLYDSITASQGLGFARVQTAGITGIEFSVRVNKIGTGIQSWQLWNETDNSEIVAIDDSGVAGVKTLLTTRTFSTPLSSGVKTVRVRAKSTVASDDPVFLGACVLIIRVERLTSQELHEVLLIAEAEYAYATETLLKSRLGV